MSGKGSSGRFRQAGVSLVEVLIAVLLVAIGTLAIVLLQLSSKRGNMEAAQRAAAAQIGYDFIERIRANNTATGLLGYQTAAGSGAAFGGGQQSYSGPNCGTGSPCTPAQLADYDARQFELQLDGAAEQIGGGNVGGLVNPRACLTANPPGGGSATFTLTIVWRGLASFPDNAAITCASATNPALYGDSNEFRRTLILNTFVAAR